MSGTNIGPPRGIESSASVPPFAEQDSIVDVGPDIFIRNRILLLGFWLSSFTVLAAQRESERERERRNPDPVSTIPST